MKALSKRAQQVTGSMTLEIDAKAKAMKAAGVDVISFGAGEPDYPTPAHICAAAEEAMAKGQTKYTPAGGTAQLKEAVCRKLLRRNGLTYRPEQIVITNGAKQALHNAFCMLLDEGDQVILPAPCWVSYTELIRMSGGEPVLVPRRREDGFRLDVNAVERAVTEKTKAILINNPDNPCGQVLEEDTLRALAAIAEKYDLYLIADEIYEEFMYDGLQAPALPSISEDAYNRTILVNGLSKSYSMTGWRVGYAAMPLQVAKKMGAWQSHATGNVNSVAQAASIAALDGPQDTLHEMVAAFDQRRRDMAARIAQMPLIECLTPQGAFYIMADISAMLGKTAGGRVLTDSFAFTEALLEQAHVAVVPGDAFFAPGMIRFSYALPSEALQEGMNRLQRFIESLQ